MVQRNTPPKVLWILGMNSGGTKPPQLAAMGYNVKSVRTIDDWVATAMGAAQHLFGIHTSPKVVQAHIDKNIEKVVNEAGGFPPDVVVGTSQGGAVAMRLRDHYLNAKFVLNAPAWKIYLVIPDMRLVPDTIVVHGDHDKMVPVEDSVELADKYGFLLRRYDTHGSAPVQHSIPVDLTKAAIDSLLGLATA